MTDHPSKENVALELTKFVLEHDAATPRTKNELIGLYKECMAAVYHRHWGDSED